MDEIYVGNIPGEMEGIHFHCKIESFDCNSKSFRMKYNNVSTKVDGFKWDHHDDDQKQMNEVMLENIGSWQELYLKIFGFLNAHEYNKLKTARTLLRKSQLRPLMM